MKEYCIYYIPKCYRDYLPNKIGKIGVTEKRRERLRYQENKALGYDMEGYEVLYEFFANDITEAKVVEDKWQQQFDLVDATKSIEYRNNSSQKQKGIPKTGGSAKGVPKSKIHAENIGNALRGIPKDTFTCPYCNKLIGGKSNFDRWHNDNCKEKK
jgi:hypothetical protein